MRAFARFIALPALTLSMAASVFAQRGGPPIRHEIIGKITNDADRSPMQNVAIRLSTQTGQVVSTTYSGPNGEYNFEDLAGADYVLTITEEGYEPVEQDARLRAIPSLTANIALHKAAGAKSEFGSGADESELSISARELALPSKAQDALAKGKERLYQKRDAARSLEYFRKVLEISPEFYEGFFLEGVAYTQLSQVNDAESAFRKAIDVSEHHYADPCFALASLLTDKKQFNDAEQMAHAGLQANPKAWRGYYELARALLGAGRLDDAEKSAMEARTRKADFAALYLVLGNIHIEMHKNEAVLEDVNTYLKLEPDGPASEQARTIKSQMERALGRAAIAPER